MSNLSDPRIDDDYYDDIKPIPDDNPDHFFFIHGLREALGKPETADPRTPKEVWEEAIQMVREGRRFDGGWTEQRRNDYADGYEFRSKEGEYIRWCDEHLAQAHNPSTCPLWSVHTACRIVDARITVKKEQSNA